MQNAIDQLVALLTDYSGDKDSFNQYRDAHPEHDLADAPYIRQRNLAQFLTAFRQVRYILLAEAAGYQGCRFSGIPMTAEVQIVGPDAVHWARAGAYRRSSARHRLWREPSATILWQTLAKRMDCLIWNTFPWHPMGKRGPLSNRPPRRNEVSAGAAVLDLLRRIYPGAQPVAIGRVAERTLSELGINPLYIRHPAHGGKSHFVAGIRSLPG